MAKRFILAFIRFVAIILPLTFGAALLAAPAKSAPAPSAGCDLAAINSGMAAMQARMKTAAADCAATRLYFLELVKTRAVTAACISGPARERELSRLDADVARINHVIAARCG